MMTDIFALAALFWVVIAAVLIANGYFVYQVRMARYRVMQSLADKGQPVPPELLGGNLRQAPVGLLRGGIVLTALGIALGVFFWSMTAPMFGAMIPAPWLPSIAFFPLMLGLALLLMAMFERRRPQ